MAFDFEQLIGVLGTFWLAALAAEFLAVLTESWGGMKPKVEGEEDRRQGLAKYVLMTAAVATPCLLLAHTFIVVSGVYEGELLLPALGAVLATVFGGNLLGWLFGALIRPAATLMQIIAMPLAIVAIITAVALSWDSLPLIATAAAAWIVRFMG